MTDNTENGGEIEKTSLPPKITKDTFHGVAATKKGKILYWAKTVAFLLVSSLLVAFAAHALIAPNDFTIGGVSGIAILVNVASKGKVPQSVLVFAINLPLVLISFFCVKKKFALLSAANILLQTAWLLVLENAFPDLRIEFADNGEKIFAALAGGICIGAATALAFKIGGSTGGADIIAVIIQRKFSASSIAQMLFLINCAIIGSSLFVFYDAEQQIAYNVLPIMMSAFESYVESKTNDSMTSGFHSAIEFRIITDKPEEMSRALMKELSRGVTSIPATGMYTKEKHSMLLCVVSRRQVATLRRIMKSIDPDSFAVMSSVSQVLGLGFYSDEI